MKLTAKLREEAACLCSAMANVRVDGIGEIPDVLILSKPTGLAWRAFDAAPNAKVPYTNRDIGLRWAEACSMLRNNEVP